MFTEKYKPEKLEDVEGQGKAIGEILKWFDSWKPGEKALLLHGPTGVGKTSVIQALANEKNLDLIEMNASNYRSAKQIRENMGTSVAQKSLFKKGKIFLIDEVDGLSGRSDRGGVGQIMKLAKITKHPMVLVANDPYDSKLKRLRKSCKMVKLKKPTVYDVERHLKKIIEGEEIEIERDALRDLAKVSKRDIRAAVNDLESLSYKKKITQADVEILSEREKEINIYKALGKIFKADSVMDARRAIDNLDMSPEEVFWWIETNVMKEYSKPEEIADAFEALSKADIFRNRIRENQNWRYLVYVIDLMTGGVASARKKKYHRFVRYQYPTMIATLGRTKGIRAKQDKILSVLAKKLHCSKNKVRTEFLPFIRQIQNGE